MSIGGSCRPRARLRRCLPGRLAHGLAPEPQIARRPRHGSPPRLRNNRASSERVSRSLTGASLDVMQTAPALARPGQRLDRIANATATVLPALGVLGVAWQL